MLSTNVHIDLQTTNTEKQTKTIKLTMYSWSDYSF